MSGASNARLGDDSKGFSFKELRRMNLRAEVACETRENATGVTNALVVRAQRRME
jgi:hypothetical protein